MLDSACDLAYRVIHAFRAYIALGAPIFGIYGPSPAWRCIYLLKFSCVYVKTEVQGSAMSWVLLMARLGREGKTGWDLDTRVSYLPTRQLGLGHDAHRHWLCYYKSPLCDLNSSLSPSALHFSAAEFLSRLYIP
jgi:hypothetical protein